jgi:MFS superfamily sulfate permease-like transporter
VSRSWNALTGSVGGRRDSCCCDVSAAPTCTATSARVSSSPHCSSRRAWHTPRSRACRRSPGSTRRSVENLKGYHDTERYPDARLIPGLVLYRFDAPLFFANADYFRERVRALARRGDVSWIVVAAEPITDIDATAGETLRGLNDELDAAGIELAFAELKDPVRDRLRRYGIESAIGAHRFFPTVGVAVASYVRDTGVDWLDWEDRQPGDEALPDQ